MARLAGVGATALYMHIDHDCMRHLVLSLGLHFKYEYPCIIVQSTKAHMHGLYKIVHNLHVYIWHVLLHILEGTIDIQYWYADLYCLILLLV